MRKRAESLSLLVRNEMGMDPMTRSIVLFCGRDRKRISAIVWDGNGYLEISKRLLVDMSFKWPRSEAEALMVTRDHCYVILAVLEKGKVGEVYNLGGHNEKANIEIVKIILAELGKQKSLITYITDRKGHDQRYAIDPSKAMRELGWSPPTMFNDGIKLTIQWYKDHMDWMRECTSGEYIKYYEEMYGDR